MARFDYVRACSVEEAVHLLGDPGMTSRALAGGTDLLVAVRHTPPDFDRLVDVGRIPELRVIARQGDEIVVGAGVRFAEAAASLLLREFATCLAEACASVGGPAIRNTGTLGGNVANAAACADSLPALVCLDAVAHVVSLSGQRSLLVSDLITGANRTALRAGELITHFSFALLPAGAHSAFTKLGRRNAQAISRLSMAAAGRVSPAGIIDYVRLSPGAAMPRPQRILEAESLLLGQKPSAELIAAAGAKTAEVMVAVTGRRWSTEYKEIAIQALAERTLRRALEFGVGDGR